MKVVFVDNYYIYDQETLMKWYLYIFYYYSIQYYQPYLLFFLTLHVDVYITFPIFFLIFHMVGWRIIVYNIYSDGSIGTEDIK